MQCEEAQELITGLIDGELTAAERSAVGGHLAECRDCKLQLERETALKRNLKQASATVNAPRGLRETMRESLGGLGSNRPVVARSRFPKWPAFISQWPVLACAVVVLIITAIVFQFRAQIDLAGDAVTVYQKIASGKTRLPRSDDGARLRKDLALAVNNKFAPIPLDLSSFKLYPVAGFVQKIGGRDALVTIYEGSGTMITCFTFLGDDSDAPKNAESLFDPEMKIHFYSFSRSGVSGVMHRVGTVNCLLVANMPPADLLAVARGRSHHA